MIARRTAILSRRKERLAVAVLAMSVVMALGAVTAVVGHVFAGGLGRVNVSFLLSPPRRMGREGGIGSVIYSTVALAGLALGLACPLGLGCAVFLTHYARPGRMTRLIRLALECLAGIPSIVYGLFGFALFVIRCGLGWSLLSGSLTLSLMVLPTIVRTAEEAIRAVPVDYYLGSMALGATRWQTVGRMVLRVALPGMMTGVLLALGRAVGETAAVLLTAGSALAPPRAPTDPARSLAVHLYVLASENVSMEKAYATGAVLLLAVLLVNLAAGAVAKRAAPGRL